MTNTNKLVFLHRAQSVVKVQKHHYIVINIKFRTNIAFQKIRLE